ncbi:hypothetical protein [Roseobacter sp. N2S]|nr:hypothetical protein [Roseobacter sp. N2S]MDR6266564.1 hypothetical protein [Roseobacter sp. N2S]
MNFLLPFACGAVSGGITVLIAPQVHAVLSALLDPLPANPFGPFSERGQ